MPGGIAVDVYGHRQTCDMRGTEFYVDFEGRGRASQPLRAGAKPVHQVEKFVFQLRITGIRIMTVHIAGTGTFGTEAGHFHIATYAYAYDHGRTGTGPGMAHGLDYDSFHSFYTISGHQHMKLSLIFASCALGSESNMYTVTRHQPDMNDGRGVVAGVLSFEQGFRH